MRFLLFIFLTFFLTACGFKLKTDAVSQLNPTPNPYLHRIYLQTSDPYGPLARYLKEGFTAANIQVVPTEIEANSTLVIMKDTNSQELLSVSGTQQTRQVNLVVTVTFQIINAEGVVLVPPQTLVEKHAITIQSNQILGSSNEASLFYQELRRELAFDIINRINSKDVSQAITANEMMKPAS